MTKRPQFRLRSLFILTAIVAVGCAASKVEAFGLSPVESVVIAVGAAIVFVGHDWKNFRIR